MKKFLLLLFIFSICFSLSTEPPISEMLSQNLEQSNVLVSAISSGGAVSIDLRAVKITPSIDGSISSEEQNFLLYYSSISLYSKDMPDLPDCGKRLVNASIELEFVFTTNNLSKIVSYSLTDSESLPKNIIIPFSENELSLAEANNSLEVFLNWKIKVNFENYEVYSPGGEGVQFYCNSGPLQTEEYFGTSNISYKIENGNLLYFLSKPVLKEQWYKNNHFDSVVLSKRKFYKGEILKNGEKLLFTQLYFFDSSYDQYGLMNILLVKNESNQELSEAIAYNVPVPLEINNESFIYVYMFNSTYEGIGKNNLTLVLYDMFGNEFTQTYEITSKMLGFGGNNSEEGTLSEYTEKSAAFGKEELLLILVPTSIIGILFILVFFKFRK